MPVNENVQAAGNPGAVAEPFAVIGIVVPLSCPDAEPDTVRPPAHTAENVPESADALWLVTLHWRLPHVDTDGSVVSVEDAQVPTYDGDEVAPPPPVEGTEVVDVGERTLLLLALNPQAVTSKEAATTVISREIILVIMMEVPLLSS